MQNRIKAQARDHERFRRVCVSFAQGIHRWDMRFRLGLLQDSAALDRQAAREAAEAQAKKHKSEAPTVKTEAQTKADDAAESRSKESLDKAKEQKKKPKIRPLSEAKAIDVGAQSLISLKGQDLPTKSHTDSRDLLSWAQISSRNPSSFSSELA